MDIYCAFIYRTYICIIYSSLYSIDMPVFVASYKCILLCSDHFTDCFQCWFHFAFTFPKACMVYYIKSPWWLLQHTVLFLPSIQLTSHFTFHRWNHNFHLLFLLSLATEDQPHFRVNHISLLLNYCKLLYHIDAICPVFLNIQDH